MGLSRNPLSGSGWFYEHCQMWPGCALSIQYKSLLLEMQTPFQLLQIFETESCGRMLALDSRVQCTEADEFIYHEMLIHPAVFCHPAPRRVLVVGGGDGGAVRELLKHDGVGHIDLCEIDRNVVAASREFLPPLSCGLSDPRVSIHYDDGAVFVRQRRGFYDIIVSDASDPIGPGEALFRQSFLEDIQNALRPGGIFISQGESFIVHFEFFRSFAGLMKEVFPSVSYSWFPVPTYPGGTLGVFWGGFAHDFRIPRRSPPPGFDNQVRYYSAETHKASFVLPPFAADVLR